MQSKIGQRAAPRKPVSIPVLVWDWEGSVRISATIRDGSLDGCRLEGPDVPLLPDTVCIDVEGLNEPNMGQIRWRRGHQAGVKFEWPLTLHEEQQDPQPAAEGSTKLVVVLDDV